MVRVQWRIKDEEGGLEVPTPQDRSPAKTVARMERSVIRDRLIPGLRFAPSGLPASGLPAATSFAVHLGPIPSPGLAWAAAIEPGDGWRWGPPWQDLGSSGGRSDGAQIVRRGLARLSISNNVESDLLSLVEPTHSSTFDGADVHEDILAAVIRLDEAEAFLDIEPLHGSLRHLVLLSVTCVVRPRASAAGSFEFWRKVVSPTRGARRGQVVRPKLDRSNVGYCGVDRKGAALIF